MNVHALRAHVSPSQIETWRGCQRKWAYSRIRPRTENEYAAFGTRVHGILERWLERREPPDHRTLEGLCALAAVPELPTPQQPGAAVEHAFAFVSDGTRFVLADAKRVATLSWHATCGGSSAYASDPDGEARALAEAARREASRLGPPWVAYVGRIDLLDAHQPGTYVRVTDYKTCGDLARASETRADFEENVQRIVYAAYVRERFRVESVVARWIYLRRKPPKAELVELVEGANVRARFERVHQKYSLPIVQSRGIHPTELPRSLDHCFSYGPRMPCPYLAECHATLDPIERAAALMSQPERGQERKSKPMDDLMAKLGASLAPAAAAPAAPTPVVDPFAGWSDQDKEAFAALQTPPPGATQEVVAAFLSGNGKQHVVDAAVRMGVITVAAALPAPTIETTAQPVIPSAPQPVTTPTSAPQAPRVRAKSFKADVVENMLRAVLAGAGHSVEQTEAHIARLLG